MGGADGVPGCLWHLSVVGGDVVAFVGVDVERQLGEIAEASPIVLGGGSVQDPAP